MEIKFEQYNGRVPNDGVQRKIAYIECGPDAIHVMDAIRTLQNGNPEPVTVRSLFGRIRVETTIRSDVKINAKSLDIFVAADGPFTG